MLALLSVEWLKLKRYRTFWILAGMFILLLPLWNYEIAKGVIDMGGPKAGSFLATAYAFPEVWGNIGFWGSFFVLFLAMLTIIITTNEYTFRTHRQNVIDGWQRMQLFHAKVYFVVVVSAISTLFQFLIALVFGYANTRSFTYAFSDLHYVGYYFVLSLNYLGFALFISLWIRRSGLAIGLLIFYAFIFENIARELINRYVAPQYGTFLPLQASDELLPFPLFKLIRPILQSQRFPERAYVLASCCWIAVYYTASRIMLTKRDW